MSMNFSQISQYHKINTSIYTENTVQYLIMREEDKLYFAALFGNLEKKVEVMAEEQKAKFAEVGSQLTHYGETLMKMKNDMTSKISEVKSSVNANVANISANTSAIASTQGEVESLKKAMSDMSKEFKDMKDQANDIQRRVYKK